jgi:hypothetical protein
MKPVKTTPRCPLFAVELHSNHPERLVAFYEEMLAVKFKATTYPFPRFAAEIGGLCVVISDARGCDPSTASTPGRVTLGLFAPERAGEQVREEEDTAYGSRNGSRYFLHTKRPLGNAYPERYATRIQDPDGHYVAFTSSMEHMLGRVAPINSFRGIVDCVHEYTRLMRERSRLRLRKAIDRLIDRWEYRTDRVAYLSRSLDGYTHVMASSEGLFAINATGYKRLLRGAMFGTTIRDNALYCFQSCGDGNGNHGRLLKLSLNGTRIERVEVIAKGLDDGCHQIDFVGDDLLIVDCYAGKILQMKPGESTWITHYPLGELTREVAREQLHMNSISRHPNGSIWVLLHNCLRKYSEVIVLDARFTVVRRFEVDAGAAHNIVFTHDDGEYLIADSKGGRLISAHDVILDTGLIMPRGIALDDRTCVVGDSFFTTRPFRRYVPGRVHFFDRATWTRTSSISMPAAPTEIRRLDGRDLSLSNFNAAQARQRYAGAAPARGEAPIEVSSRG